MREKRFGTFVVRYWALPQGEGRLEIEHVQSGERHRCASLPEAEAWIVARVHAPTLDNDERPRRAGAEASPGDSAE
jgi:hypothetical protein